MTSLQLLKLAVLSFVLTVMAATGEGAEIELRTEAWPTTALVRLGDVAQLRHEDPTIAAKWAEIVLFPMPASGKLRIVKQQELAQLLAFSDSDLVGCRIAGAAACRLHGIGPDAAIRIVAAKPVPLPKPTVQRVSATAPIAPQLVAAAPAPVVVAAATPIVERQAVVAVRRLERGQRIRAEDVAVQNVDASRVTAVAYDDVELVVGREATHAIPASEPLTAEMLRQPRLVHRNEPVTVRSIAAGILVTTSGKALEDGSENSVVQIELADSRERITARVTGIQQVEVYAGSPRVASATPRPPKSEISGEVVPAAAIESADSPAVFAR